MNSRLKSREMVEWHLMRAEKRFDPNMRARILTCTLASWPVRLGNRIQSVHTTQWPFCINIVQKYKAFFITYVHEGNMIQFYRTIISN